MARLYISTISTNSLLFLLPVNILNSEKPLSLISGESFLYFIVAFASIAIERRKKLLKKKLTLVCGIIEEFSSINQSRNPKKIKDVG